MGIRVSAGTTIPFHFGSHLNGRQANCDGTMPYGNDTEGPHLEKTSPVGKYLANAWGLHDMHGCGAPTGTETTLLDL